MSLQRLETEILDALSPTAAAVFGSDPDGLPPLVLQASCLTWLEWICERLQLERYGCVAARPVPLGHQADTHTVFSIEDGSGDEIVDRLAELGRVSNVLQAGAKRQIVVRNLHSLSASARSRLRHALDTCQAQCSVVFLSTAAFDLHGRCAVVNCNPPKSRWRDVLARVVPDAEPGSVEAVVADPRSSSLIAATLLLDARVPEDALAARVGPAVAKLVRPDVTPAQALGLIRQVSKFACQNRLTLANLVDAWARGAGADPCLAAAVVRAGRMAPDTTSRHTLLAIETLLWHVYARGQDASPVL
jgi:hypothetical protein